MTGTPDEDILSRKKEFLTAYLRKGAEFIEELLRDNENLRLRIAQLEEELASMSRSNPTVATLRELVERIHTLETERVQLLDRFGSAQRQTVNYELRFAEIERENNTLANLYIAAQALGAASGPKAGVQICYEVLRNFVGARRFAIQMVDRDSGVMRAVVSGGVETRDVPPIPIDSPLGKLLTTGDWLLGPFREFRSFDEEPAVCVPIKSHERSWGVMSIWELLSQKEGFVDVDRELLKLLSSGLASLFDAAALDAELGETHVLPFSTLTQLLNGG